MPYDTTKLYALLPAIDRIRDAEQGEPLQALLAAIAEQIAVLEADLAQLYDDQFIETCADWVVPYIGDLIGVRTLHGNIPSVSSPRSEVANTIGYRRRKGTATMLEQLARDVTDWDARVVELFQWLGTTQYMQHIRPFRGGTLNLRDSEACDRITNNGGAFETTDRVEVIDHATSTMRAVAGAFNTAAHTADVRRISRDRGQFNIPNIGVFLWRLTAYPIQQGTACSVNEGYTFHPLGMDAPLFNHPQPETEITHLAEPINVSEPLRRRSLYDELERLRQALANGGTEVAALLQGVYFGARLEWHPFRIFKDGVEIPAKEVMICDLSDWRRSPTSQSYQPKPTPENPEPAPKDLPIQVAVDPRLGRLTFPAGVSPEQVNVSYVYGFSADIGGGPYSRPQTGTPTQVVRAGGPSLAVALANTGTNHGIIEINDSTTISGNFNLTLGAGQQFTLRSRDGARSVIDGAITITTAANASVTLDGLLISQGIQIAGTANLTLTLRHCTLAPWLELESDEPKPLTNPAIYWQANGGGHLTLDRTITGRLIIHPSVPIAIHDCIVDALGDNRVALAASEDGGQAAGTAKVGRTTVLGRIHVSEMEQVENSILTGVAISDRKQTGCVRFSYLPPSSRAPRRYRCQPDLALAEKVRELKLNAVENLSASDRAAIQTRLIPQFTSRRYSHPGYCQLSRRCVTEIRQGADDESEMGAFHDLFQPQRETNLRIRFDEYLRFGLEAGIIYVT